VIKKEKLRKPEKEGPKGIFKSPWSLHIGIFQILLPIIPPNGKNLLSIKISKESGE